jgi:hypothetical protein
MDFIRSCYSTKARFFADSDRESNIRWYFAEDGAKVFPGRHVFGSLNYGDADYAPPGPVGELAGRPRTWRDGSVDPAFPTQAPDGQLSDFVDGAEYDETFTLDRRGLGVPLDCLPFCARSGEFAVLYAHALEPFQDTAPLIFSPGGWFGNFLMAPMNAVGFE